MCKEMPTDIENKCCKQKRFLSKTNVFVNICIDRENLQTAIGNLSDIYVFTPRYANKSMQHAPYHQYVMQKHGHVGARRWVDIPSCCVCTIWNAYPSPTNRNTGFLNVGGLALCDEWSGQSAIILALVLQSNLYITATFGTTKAWSL